MEQKDVMEKIVEIVKPFVNDKEALKTVSKDTDFLRDLKINSSRLVDITLEFEDAFKITISDDEADSIDTVGAAISLIQNKVGSGSQASPA